MSNGYPTHSSYQDTGIEWLGRVPEYWTVSKFANVKTVLTDFTANGSFADLRRHVQYRDVPSYARLVRLTDLRLDLNNQNGVWIDEKAYKYLAKSSLGGGEFLLANVGAYAGLFYRMPLDKGRCSLAPNMFMAKFDAKRVTGEFMAYVGQGKSASSQLFLRARASSAQPKLNKDDFKSVRFAYPPLQEQTQITKFLDYETAKIDALIDKQQQLIALLQEKRQAVISHAVTKGLNPDAPMRDSGVEWLGEVPAHWEIIALKHLVQKPIIDGPHETPIKRDEGIPFVSAESVSKGYIDFDKIWGYISPEDHIRYSQRYTPELGDILMVKLGATTGVVAIVETKDDFNIWVPLAVIRSKPHIEPRFIFHVLRSESLKNAYQINWTYGTQQTLGLRTISNLRLPIPSEKEMKEIVEQLDSILPSFESLTARAEQAVELLQERRTALISAAVTGKIDVRGWQPPSSKTEGERP